MKYSLYKVVFVNNGYIVHLSYESAISKQDAIDTVAEFCLPGGVEYDQSYAVLERAAP